MNPKEVEENVVKETVPSKTGKWVLKRTKKPDKKPSKFEITKPTSEPIVQNVDLIAETIPMENPAPIAAIITQEGEPAVKKRLLKEGYKAIAYMKRSCDSRDFVS